MSEQPPISLGVDGTLNVSLTVLPAWKAQEIEMLCTSLKGWLMEAAEQGASLQVEGHTENSIILRATEPMGKFITFINCKP